MREWFGPQSGKGKIPEIRANNKYTIKKREENGDAIMNCVDDSTHGIEDKHDQDEKVE